MRIYKKLLKLNPYNVTQGIFTPKRIVIHYTGDVNATADALSKFNDNTAKGYFKDYKNQINTSEHFIVGFDGKIIMKVDPSNNKIIPHHVGSVYNPTSIGIEVCYNKESGEFTEAAINALSELVPYLMKKYNIDYKNVVRHYDLTRKLCPYYYVDANKWKDLKDRITGEYKKENKKIYRIIAGAFTNRDNANKFIKTLKNKGISAYIEEDDYET